MMRLSTHQPRYRDWGEASEEWDYIAETVASRDLVDINEAQTRFDVIDRIIGDIWGWRYGNISVEEHSSGERQGYIDYLLRLGDSTIVVEAKKYGAAFPSPTRKAKLKLSGNVLGTGEIAGAIRQATTYAEDKGADVVLVTNGKTWCFFSATGQYEEAYAYLLFPFDVSGHAEQLFDFFATVNVEKGMLKQITNTVTPAEDRLINFLRSGDSRVDRNNVADHIIPALDNALYADALIANPEALRECYVATEGRTRFDGQLGVHLADVKPETVAPARRIKRDKRPGPLDHLVVEVAPSYAPPVTAIIGPVGAGKSTYLKHFEIVSGRRVLQAQKGHWIYIDFEEMGREASPRAFLYRRLRDYLGADHPDNPIDYKSLVEPAYEQEIAALARGPLAPIFTQKELFHQKIAEHISREYEAVEPYVDKLLSHLSSTQLCVVVLDNVDLYEDTELEAKVFAEGLALSRRVRCHVIVSIRDTTFVKHRSGSVFDAYELRKLWLDPPPFPAVLSSRLAYSKQILKGKSARIDLSRGIRLSVPDLSAFFDIVQRSVLQGDAGQYISAVADLNIRRGLMLVTNLLTSGHIQADRVLRDYIDGNTATHFPFHEIFKGTMLGQWMHYKEERSDALNLFDSRLGAKRVRLLRLILLNHIYQCAKRENTIEVQVAECVRILSHAGASPTQVLSALDALNRHALIRTATAEEIGPDASVVITRAGGYYLATLTRKFVYVESCMFDTAIGDADAWSEIADLTMAISSEPSPLARMKQRRERLQLFLQYLQSLESEMVADLPGSEAFSIMGDIRSGVMEDVTRAVESATRSSRRQYNRNR